MSELAAEVGAPAGSVQHWSTCDTQLEEKGVFMALGLRSACLRVFRDSVEKLPPATAQLLFDIRKAKF